MNSFMILVSTICLSTFVNAPELKALTVAPDQASQASQYTVSSEKITINTTNIKIPHAEKIHFYRFLAKHWIAISIVSISAISVAIIVPIFLVPLIKNLLNKALISSCDITSSALTYTPISLSDGVLLTAYNTLCHLMINTSYGAAYECLSTSRTDLRSASIICDSTDLAYMKANGTSMCGCDQFICYNSSGVCRNAEIFPDIICRYNHADSSACGYPIVNIFNANQQPLQAIALNQYVDRIALPTQVLCVLFDISNTNGYTKYCYFAREMSPSAIANQIGVLNAPSAFDIFYAIYTQNNADIGNWFASYTDLPLLGYTTYYNPNTAATGGQQHNLIQSTKPFYMGFPQWVLHSMNQFNSNATVCDQHYSNYSCADYHPHNCMNLTVYSLICDNE